MTPFPETVSDPTLGHKIVGKKIGGLPKVSRLKHEF